MDASLLDVAITALSVLLEPERLFYLGMGTIIGLALGIMPGVGGVAGLALLLPFTFNLDAYSAFAFMLGLGAVTSTSDTIPAVLFGVPGTSASQATVLDGHSMAKNGEAGRALSAAYAASLIGGLWGAFLLGLTIPVLRPILLTHKFARIARVLNFWPFDGFCIIWLDAVAWFIDGRIWNTAVDGRWRSANGARALDVRYIVFSR